MSPGQETVAVPFCKEDICCCAIALAIITDCGVSTHGLSGIRKGVEDFTFSADTPVMNHSSHNSVEEVLLVFPSTVCDSYLLRTDPLNYETVD